MVRRRGHMLAPGTLLALAIALVHPPAHGTPPTPDEQHAIDNALPRERVPADRLLLIYTGCQGYVHDSIPVGVHAITRTGEVSGAWSVVVTDNPSIFANLGPFDAVLLLSTTGTLFTDEAWRRELVRFVHEGGGLVGIHAATDCFYDWPEFGALIGGWFDGHPWHERVVVEVEEPGHPVMRAFEGADTFAITDEIYQFRDPYTRERNRVLARLAPWAIDLNRPGIHRTDGDFAVSWVRRAGEGRIFYTSLGHRREIFWNPQVLRHYRDGIRFALGDLEADARPSAEVHGGLSTAAALQALRTWTPGAGRTALRPIEQALRTALAAERDALRDGLIEIATDPTPNPEARRFALRQVRWIDDPSVVEALSPLLDDHSLAPDARATLDHLRRHEGFVTTWSVAGPYDKPGTPGDQLMGVRFGPEEMTGGWQPLDEAAIDAPGTVDFGRLYGGDNRCAYLRTVIRSRSVRSVELRVGSDDGCRVWFNGNTVLERDVQRAHRPEEDRVKVVLKPGVNVVMMKVTQGAGGWQASCRVVAADGRGLEGIEFTRSF